MAVIFFAQVGSGQACRSHQKRWIDAWSGVHKPRKSYGAKSFHSADARFEALGHADDFISPRE
jgi:hypothetical protein